MRAAIAAVILIFSYAPELWGQRPVRPVDDGFPRYPVASVQTEFAALWRQRAHHPYVCVVGRVALDSSAATYVQVDSLRVADEPWTACNDPAVMGVVKMVDEQRFPAAVARARVRVVDADGGQRARLG